MQKLTFKKGTTTAYVELENPADRSQIEQGMQAAGYQFTEEVQATGAPKEK